MEKDSAVFGAADTATFGVLGVDECGARPALQRLAASTCAAVRWPGLLSNELDTARREVEQLDYTSYDEERLFPPILKVGPAVYDYYTKDRVEDSYWDRAERASEEIRRIFGGTDVAATLLERIGLELGIPAAPASVDGRPLHVGILREFVSGSKVHYDEIAREYPGHLDIEPIVQLAFNLHVTVASGGELTIWKHRWIPHDDRKRDGYGWHPDLMTDVPSTTVRATAGEAVLFDCRNFHRVAMPAAGRRITFSFFCGFTMDGRLIAWS
jgi:hypothetical protein